MGLEEQIKSHLAADFEAAWLARDAKSLGEMIADLTSFLGYAIACATRGLPNEAEGMRQDVEEHLGAEVAFWAEVVRRANDGNIIRPVFGNPAAENSAVMQIFLSEES